MMYKCNIATEDTISTIFQVDTLRKTIKIGGAFDKQLLYKYANAPSYIRQSLAKVESMMKHETSTERYKQLVALEDANNIAISPRTLNTDFASPDRKNPLMHIVCETARS